MKRKTTEEFIEACNNIHNGKYDYSKVEYVNNKNKVCIICPNHGEFYQTPNSHLNGQGCPCCGNIRITTARQKDTSHFISDAILTHNDKYNYSKVKYTNSQTKVCIICKEHGEFWQTPANHLQGHGCKKCQCNKINQQNTSNTNDFILKSKLIHGNRYDYSKVNYINAKTKVCISCNEHGEFHQTPNMHLYGQGCPKCGGSHKLTLTDFVKKAQIVHYNKYDYSKVEYKNNQSKICVICPEHGEFWQTASEHLRGKGCPKCAGTTQLTTKDFIKNAKITHKDKYDYSKVNYINAKTKVCIICPDHGEFWQNPYKHTQGQGCPKCSNNISETENHITDLLSPLKPQQHNREILSGKELDIYIPSLKLGVEYNGLRWHSEEFGKDKNYHIGKLNKCNSKGVKLIQIFEDEWVNHREVCESKLKHICGLDRRNPKVFARKCKIVEISNEEAKQFLNRNDIKEFEASSVYLGCYTSDNQLMGTMSFRKENSGFWEMNQFATDINFNCVGVVEKLFKHFTRHYDFHEIKSFADRRWTVDTTNNLYTKLGFNFVEFTKPEYFYIKGNVFQRFNKFAFSKQILHEKYGLSLSLTKDEMLKELGYTKIWDCGLIKYIYKKEDVN